MAVLDEFYFSVFCWYFASFLVPVVVIASPVFLFMSPFVSYCETEGGSGAFHFLLFLVMKLMRAFNKEDL